MKLFRSRRTLLVSLIFLSLSPAQASLSGLLLSSASAYGGPLGNGQVPTDGTELIDPMPGNLKKKILQIIKAYGGVHQMLDATPFPVRYKATVQTYNPIGQVENEYEMITNGDKWRIAVIGRKENSGYNGKTGWSQKTDDLYCNDAVVITDITKSNPNTHIFFDGFPFDGAHLSPLTKTDTQFFEAKSKMVDGKLCHGILVKPAQQKTYTAYIDPSTHLIARIEYQSVDPISGAATTDATEFLDFKPTFGSMLASRQIDYSDGKKTTETIVSSIVRDNSISDSFFDPPKHHKIPTITRYKKAVADWWWRRMNDWP